MRNPAAALLLLFAMILLIPVPSTGAQESPRMTGATDAATPEERFWHWFAQHAKELYHVRNHSDSAAPILVELQEEITRVHPLLVGVVDGIRQDGRRIFIISAGGRREGFGAVRSLARATPRFNGWKVFTYVPGRLGLRDYTADDISVRSQEVRALFFHGEPDDMMRIQLLIPGYTPDREVVYRDIARQLLFDAIGEYELATRVESILLDSADSPRYREAIPYRGIPTEFNAYWHRVRRPR